MGGYFKHVRDIQPLTVPYQALNPPGRELKKYEMNI